MTLLAIIAVLYFLAQAAFFWWLGRTNLRSGIRSLAAFAAIFLLPAVMYVDGLFREFGDGGAANAVVSLFAAAGGFMTAFFVFAVRSVTKEV